MLNCRGEGLIVYAPKIKLDRSEKILFASLAVNKKTIDENGNLSYETQTWNAAFAGNAFSRSKELTDGDSILITGGVIKNRYDTEKRKKYHDVVVFDFEKSENAVKSTLEVKGRWLTVFEPADVPSEGIVTATLVSYTKNTDETGDISYTNMRWKAIFPGDMYDQAKALRSKDKIDVEGEIFKVYNKKKREEYVNVVVKEFFLSSKESSDDKNQS
jgi:hypothetical protein